MEIKTITRKAGTNRMTRWLFVAIMAIAIMMGITSFHTPITANAAESQPFTTAMIAAGYGQTLALKEDGTVWAWGNNQYGQLGDGSTTNRTTPVQVVAGASGSGHLTDIIAVATGGNEANGTSHSVALKKDGTVWAWGRNVYGKLGDGTTTTRNTPVKVTGLDDVKIVAISAGLHHTVALDEDGTVWAWGQNSSGQLGNGTTTDSLTPVQVKIDSDTYLGDIIAITAGEIHTVALKEDGTVWAWGYNGVGQLGNGTITNSNTPVKATGLDDVKIVAISAGKYFTVALDKDGNVWAWGQNSSGQLGNGESGSGQYKTTPVQVLAGESDTGCLTDITAISAGEYHTVVLKKDGTVYAWGSNGYGRLGNGNNSSSVTPVQVLAGESGTGCLTDITAISVGEYHTVALKEDGTVWAWGQNNYGQLGNGTTSGVNANSTPVQTLGGATGSTHLYLIDRVQIVSQTTTAAAALGGDTTFSVGVTSGSACAYQWQVKMGGYWYTIVDNEICIGATNATLTLTGVTYAMNGYQYRCEVTNKYGTVTSNAATLTVNKENGGTVLAPTKSSTTINSITINEVTAPISGQTVEYAINITTSSPINGWQTNLTFYGLTANTTYYIFARSAENNNYSAGTAVYTEIKTDSLPTSTAPSITTTTLGNGVVGSIYTQNIIATGDATILFSLESGNLPNGLNLLANGTITGTPTKTDTFNFVIRATNNVGSVTKTLSITIAQGTGATTDSLTLIYASKTSTSITVNTVTAPANGQSVEYAINTSNNVPATGWQSGVTFTGLLANTTYYIFARAKANNDYNAGTAVSISVTTDPASPSAPVISTANLDGGNIGLVYSQTLNSSGSNLIWSIESGKLPDGLTLLSNGNITGTPLTKGIFNFTVKVNNNEGSDSKALSIIIIDNSVSPVAPSITGGQSTMTLTEGYSATSTSAFTITGNDNVIVTKINGDAKITWNDTAKKLEIAAGLSAGTYVVTLKASNGTYPDALFTFTLTVNSGTVETPDTGLSAGAAAGITAAVMATLFIGGFSVIWFVIKKKKFSDLFSKN